MKKISSLLLAFIMLLSVGTAVPVISTAASLPKSSVTSIVVFPCGFTANFSKQKNITGYQVQYSTSNKFNTKDTKAVRTTNTYSAIRKLGSSKRYYVRVRTYKKSGNKYTYSAWSASKPVTTLNKNCPDPAHIKSLKGGNKKFTATTFKSANAGGYQIRYSTKSDLSNAKIVTVYGNNNTTINVTGCAAGTKYYVQSRTFRKVNGKTYYSYWSPTTKNVTTNKAPTTTKPTTTKKPTTTTKKMLSKADVEWVQTEANKYIESKGVSLNKEAGGYSDRISTVNFTSREELLSYVKRDIDCEYQELKEDRGDRVFTMYVKIEPYSDGRYWIYIMYR